MAGGSIRGRNRSGPLIAVTDDASRCSRVLVLPRPGAPAPGVPAPWRFRAHRGRRLPPRRRRRPPPRSSRRRSPRSSRRPSQSPHAALARPAAAAAVLQPRPAAPLEPPPRIAYPLEPPPRSGLRPVRVVGPRNPASGRGGAGGVRGACAGSREGSVPYGRWGSGAPPCRTGSPLPVRGGGPALGVGNRHRGAARCGGAGQWPVNEPSPSFPRAVDGGTAKLMPDVDRDRAWLLTVDGAPQSYVDLDDPTHLEFESTRVGSPTSSTARAPRPRRWTSCTSAAVRSPCRATRGSHPPGIAAGGGGGGPGAARPGRGAPARARRLGHHRASAPTRGPGWRRRRRARRTSSSGTSSAARGCRRT